MRDGLAFHYDSLSPINSEEAEGAAAKLSVLLNLDEKGEKKKQQRNKDGGEGEKKLKVVEMESAPQQANSSDCGVFVCMIMRHLLLKKLLVKDRTEKVDLGMGRSTVNAVAGRKEMARTIEGFREEGKRRGS